MITDKIKGLFQFIVFLNSNIENFKQFDNEVSELYLLNEERNKLNPRTNFADKLKVDELQAKIEDKFKVIEEHIIQPIRAKVSEFHICDLNKTETLWNWSISEILNLKENFGKEDIPEILLHKIKYLEFRKETNCTYFQDFFFSDLDRILKELFDFFNESKESEFEAFETKPIQVNSISEAVEQFQKGNKKLILPIDYSHPSKVQQTNNEAFPPQQNNKVTPTLPEIKPMFIPEAIETIFNILKDHFSPEQQPPLKEILKSGNNASELLLFKGNGNRLADAFKQLFEKDFITGCQKKELQKWIFTNFLCLKERKPANYKTRTLEDIISGNKAPCKKPLFIIERNKLTGEQLIRKT